MSNIGLPQQRPPYVEFEQRSEEDRTASLEQKMLIMKDVDYAIIRALGSKDSVEKPALEWLGHLDRLARQGEYPREWVKFFREQYDEWKAGHEAPARGFAIKDWGSISKAQAENLIALRVLTVEDLAAANEETLQRIGMGARGLKDRAQAWLDSRAQNVNAEELAALRGENAAQKVQIETLIERIEALEAKAKAEASETPAKPARSRAAA